MSASLPKRVLYYGRDEPLPEQIPLRAGPLSLIYDAGDLRYVKLGGREVIRRIYAAVRDRNWGTVPGGVSNLKFDVRKDSFRISYVATHGQGRPTPDPSQEGNGRHDAANAVALSEEGGANSSELIHFVWNGEIIGEADGTIRFTFDGEARTTFLKNRIGFCVLHPIRECAGAPCRVEYVDGTSKTVAFPKLVAAEQPVKDIHELKAIAHEVQPGVWAELRFEGDVFEMEDQRNWIDASFKTFCTPLTLPFPVEIKAGTRVRQSVALKLSGIENWKLRIENLELKVPNLSRANQSNISQFSILNSQSPVPLPQIGLGMPSEALHVDAYSSVELETITTRLSALRLNHLRVELTADEPSAVADFSVALSWAVALGVALETALFLTEDPERELRAFAQGFDDWIQKYFSLLKRLSVFRKGEKASNGSVLSLARKHLSTFLPDTRLGGGTNADFYQLNQCRPPADLCDFICWSINPQVHAFDNASLAETPSAIPAQIESARAYFPGKPLVVSPVTLKPRSNPVATGKEAPALTGQLPSQVDPRQLSLFGAGWTLAAFKHLAESGVDGVTFYETTGWRGVMESEAGSPLPDKFPSIPGCVFPLYHVLADIGEFAGGEIVVSRSSEPMRVEGLVMQKGDRKRVMLANMTERPQTTIVDDLQSIAGLKRLNETNAEWAMREPEEFRGAAGEVVQPRDGRIELELMPYEIVTIEG